jgi:hypothetical protein
MVPFTAYNVAQLPHLSKLTVSMYSGSMLVQLKQSGILQRFRLACPRLRICDLECREADITLAPLLHSLAEGSPLLETLRIRARTVVMPHGTDAGRPRAGVSPALRPRPAPDGPRRWQPDACP